MSPLSYSASLLEHCQCFPREDVFLILALGCVLRNTVSWAVFPDILPVASEYINGLLHCRCKNRNQTKPDEIKPNQTAVYMQVIETKPILTGRDASGSLDQLGACVRSACAVCQGFINALQCSITHCITYKGRLGKP